MRIEIVENGFFWAKYQFVTIFRRMPTSGVTESCVDLSSASIYSSYNIVL